MRKLNILIFDGSLKTTAFINRLIDGLSKSNNVHVLGFNTQLDSPIHGVHYHKLGDPSNKFEFIFLSFILVVKQLFYKGGLTRLFQFFLALFSLNIQKIKKQNFYNKVISINPDIIHLQWPSLIPIVEEILINKTYKVVLSQRGYHINVRAMINDENLNYLKKWFPRIDGFHSVCDAIRENSKLIYSSQNKIDDVVYSGLGLETLNYNNNYVKKNQLFLLSVGRSHWKKGYASMMQVCAKLKETEVDFSYTIIGADTNDEELIYLIKEYKLEEKVVLKPKIPQDQVFKQMRSASALILPSLEEGIANVAIEAMAIGLPVISTDCGGMSELIEDDKSGFLTPLHDIEGFVNTIMKFHKLRIEEIDNLRVEARKTVELQHSIDKMIIDMENLYFKCLA